MFLMDESHLGAAFLFALSSVATSFLNACLLVMSMLLIMRSFGPEKSLRRRYIFVISEENYINVCGR